METTSLVNIGELSRPATVLIEKIAQGVGGLFQPWQIRRVAEAEADAAEIRAESEIQIDELKHRALQRFVEEETKKQINMENITRKALPLLEENAHPENIENDWIMNFFDKCRLISDDEIQILWSKILAGEANNPGTYSRRTINFLGSLDRADALLFKNLCRFCWSAPGPVPLVYNIEDDIYKNNGIYFLGLQHLDEIGLLSFNQIAGYKHERIPHNTHYLYYGIDVEIEFKKEDDNEMGIGHVYLSRIGRELTRICDSEPIPEFFEYIIDMWKNKFGLTISYNR